MMDSKNTIRQKKIEHFAHLIEKLDLHQLIQVFPKKMINDLAFYNFQNAITACYFADRDLTIRKVNKEFLSLFNEDTDLVGRNLSNIFKDLGLDEKHVHDFKQQLGNNVGFTSHKSKSSRTANCDIIRFIQPILIITIINLSKGFRVNSSIEPKRFY